ncbi:type II toxin-antitoxin system VapC family toxin [Arcicella sp. LKC2W]|uniref:type II toxin-antitoxin system VapC family toxin n=1 Tax=Arcicella sp. LKC2W TaxID=2984198 RepID=UPI002B1F2B67|nr:type II toxin-antitoxin system VapC family toxin [Arcicella sp. LKC2W]MEA5460505.1 type II toxin-antitoxin system VapC family toxin [Arcicella sp. LKC2W]
MYLLDTNTVIDFCTSKLPVNAKNLLVRIEPKNSVISRIELFASSKISLQEKETLELFVEMATNFDHIDEDIIAKTIRLRQQYKTQLPDAIIAATALVNDLILITRNSKDFEQISDLQVINPYNI